MVFRGGTIYTVDATQPTPEAVAIRGGRIVYVGDASGLDPWIGSETQVVELEGRMLLPAFHDTHVHPVSGGIELGECDINAAETRSEVLSIVSACATTGAEGEWLQGGGYQLPIFPNGAPSKELLDSLVPDRPAFLSSADGHSAWVNSRALEISGVTAATADPPPDGVILKTASGDVQGTLREGAMGLVSRHIPERSDAGVLAGLMRGLEMAARFGIASLHEASADESFLRAYAEAERQGLLTARALVALRVDNERGVDQVPGLVALRDRYSGRLVRPVAAKIFLDGVIEGGTAALLEPYVDRPGWRGTLNMSADSLNAVVAALDDAGFKVHIHAIGDWAIRASFDAFEMQKARDGGIGPRHIMAHIQLFDPVDVGRFAMLGVVASFQPVWLYEDSYITDLTVPRLGPERSEWLYPLASVVESGAIVAAGSDWSVSSMDPLRAIEVALTRRSPEVEEGQVWLPEQRVDIETMLRAYTLAGAQAADLESETGSITVGKSADLIVVDRNLLAIAPQRISEARVDLTLFEGRVVYARTPGGA